MAHNISTSLVIILFALAGCGKTDAPTAPAAVRTPAWTAGTITQPVPSWGSSTRLVLPVRVDQIALGPSGGIGGFGSHQGGHIEGLDHVWIEVSLGIPICSWADGRVTRIEDMGGEFFITIEYGGGLTGKHMEVKTPLVVVGQSVKAGDPVAYGLTYGSFQSAEFCLNDNSRNDGVIDGRNGSYVSAFDYLRDDVKASLEAAYTQNVIQPFLMLGRDAGNNHPVEPYLTNPVLFHSRHKGTMAGEWLLHSKWAMGGYPDILTLLDVENGFYKGKRLLAADDGSQGQTVFDGTWSADSAFHRFTFASNSSVMYGLYALDETGDRAALTIEYATGAYPASFSAKAAVYFERIALPRRADAEQMGVY